MTNETDFNQLEQLFDDILEFLMRLNVCDGEHQLSFADYSIKARRICVDKCFVSLRDHCYYLEPAGRGVLKGAYSAVAVFLCNDVNGG